MRVCRGDLPERTVSLPAVVAGEIQPPRGILVALEQILKGDSRRDTLLRDEEGSAHCGEEHRGNSDKAKT
jgi:hypothetical protein